MLNTYKRQPKHLFICLFIVIFALLFENNIKQGGLGCDSTPYLLIITIAKIVFSLRTAKFLKLNYINKQANK